MGAIKKFTLFGAALAALLISGMPVAAQEVTPTDNSSVPGTGGLRRLPSRFPTIKARITEFKQRVDERRQQLVERIKHRAQKVVERLRNVIERLRRHVNRLREAAQRLATERGVSVAAVESLLQSAEGKIASAETKLNELAAAVEAIDPSTSTLPSAIDALYGKFRSIHEDLMGARGFLFDALRTLNELRVSSRPTRPPFATGAPAATVTP